MNTAGRVSARALRILTYTLMIKVVTDVVTLICEVFVSAGTWSGSVNWILISSIYFVARAVVFFNTVICVRCLCGINIISRHFVTALKLFAAVLLTDCMLLVLVAAKTVLDAGEYGNATAVGNTLLLAVVILERPLAGAAFLFLAKGFGEGLRRSNKGEPASAIEKLGMAYFCCSIAAGSLVLFWGELGTVIAVCCAVLKLVGAVLGLVLYFKVSDAAFSIWRSSAFGISDDLA